MALQEIFGDNIVNKQGESVSVDELGKNNYIGIYFSAHWCPPCRTFTPALCEFYEKKKAEAPGNLEIVFVSFDRDDDSFAEYYGTMPWLTFKFSEKEKREELASKFSVSGIPMFLVMDNQGEVIVENARGNVADNPDGFPWK